MSFNMRQKHDLVQILTAGGSLVLDGGMRSTFDLVELASAARVTAVRISGVKLTLTNMSARSTFDLVQIASAGKGAVVFTD